MNIDPDIINAIVGSPSGNELELTYSVSDEIIQSGPYNFELNQVFPNPFNPVTTIDFTIPRDDLISISIYNILGENVEIVYNGYQDKGSYSFNWDASNHTSGIYYIQLKQGKNIQTTKSILMK